MRFSYFRPFLAAVIVFVGLAVVGLVNKKPYSLSLTSVSASLSNSRLSFKGALSTGNTVGASFAFINTTQGAYPSTSATQLVAGDVVRIGPSYTMGSYTVASTSAHNLTYLTTVLGAGNATAGNDVISTASANVTVKLTTTNAIAGGRFRILIPAESTDALSTDGIPDVGKWDGGFNNSSPNINASVTCPADVSSTYDFVTGTATRSAISISGSEYHSFECAYSGGGAVGTVFDGVSNGSFLVSNLINPAPGATHTIGIADTPRIVVQHLNANMQTIDQTIVAVGLIEAVKVTASVAPQISFQIIGVNVGSSGLCDGTTTNVTTTPNVVPLGDLLTSAFTVAAHSLSVSTNAVNGYAVTVRENNQLARNGNAACTGDPGKSSAVDPRTTPTNSDCIPDTIANGASSAGTGDDATHAAPAEWNNTAYKGFGYTLRDVNSVSGMTTAFQYNTNSGNCTGAGNCFKQFADTEAGEAAQTVISSAGPADNHNVYICYKAVISTTQAAGDYENYLTFIATATF